MKHLNPRVDQVLYYARVRYSKGDSPVVDVAVGVVRRVSANGVLLAYPDPRRNIRLAHGGSWIPAERIDRCLSVTRKEALSRLLKWQRAERTRAVTELARADAATRTIEMAYRAEQSEQSDQAINEITETP